MLEAVMKEISVHAAVRLTKFTRAWVYSLIFNGRIKARKCGRKYRIDVASLERYLDERPRWAKR